jgi:type I restriction enzyme S subunit
MTEGPYKLPKGWRWVKLEDVCKYDRRTIDPRRFPEQYFCLYSIPAYDKGRQPELLKGSEIGSAKLSIDPDDICLFSKLNPRIPRSWILKKNTINSKFTLIASTEFMPLRVQREILDLEYLGFYLLSNVFLVQVCAGATGATGSRKRLKPENVLNALIPLPPIEEQRQIIAWVNEMLTRVREAKRLRQEAQQEAERLWQSVLADTFPKPGTKLPNGWQWVKLEDIAQVFSGSSAPQNEDYFTEGKYPFVRVSDLSSSVDGYITKTRDAVNDKAIKELKLIKAAAGTIVFPKSGAAILTNARAILAIDAYIVSHLAALSPDRSKADKDWLYYYLSTVDMGQYSDNPSYPSLKLSRIKNIEIPLPNLIKQREIVAYLKCIHEKVQSMKEAQAQTEAELQRLEQAILDKAFLGEL